MPIEYYYNFIITGLGVLILISLIIIGIFYKRQRKYSRDIIENLKKEITAYKSMVDNIQGKIENSARSASNDSASTCESGEKDKSDKERRIWVKIKAFNN